MQVTEDTVSWEMGAGVEREADGKPMAPFQVQDCSCRVTGQYIWSGGTSSGFRVSVWSPVAAGG